MPKRVPVCAPLPLTARSRHPSRVRTATDIPPEIRPPPVPSRSPPCAVHSGRPTGDAVDLCFQAGIVVQQIGDFVACVCDREAPGISLPVRLEFPLQKVQQQDRQTADEFALFGLAHAFDFLGDMLEVGPREFAGAQQFGLFAAPGVEISIVKRGFSRHFQIGLEIRLRS